ncbi:Succinyl-diaminopimelate desuccinylase [Tepidimonas charontis]|uniref:Succinyl-diaminopimelate desuccinylase n=2 Tax=Tepidimonas charontis TaxID=2267262 RepID=A0A554XJA4_9BURK|nr:Succinyl-diaminopimelate desuccinylase [Tepidimonas charontis]
MDPALHETHDAGAAVVQLTEALIGRPSVTPDDAGCQALLAERLSALGFQCETLVSGPPEFRVTNLWALRPGATPQAPVLVFAGHTDVVPTGPREHWHSDPFTPTLRDGKLYGRGASDMKASLAAMVVACERFLAESPNPPLSIGFLLTSDEEGPARDGTVVVCEALRRRGQRLDYCIVGEPTSVRRTGDMIKNGRRGTMSGRLTVKGIQGHIAYPHLARNPIHLLAPALAELVATRWDDGNAHFPPTTWQVSHIHAGTGASNVIPGTVVLDFNFRFSTESTPEGLQARVSDILARHGLRPGQDYELAWTVGGLPFLTPRGTLVDAIRAAIRDVTGTEPELSTTGGTSDGRFIAQICPQVVECGPPNTTIHQVDECIDVEDLKSLTHIYHRILQRLTHHE